LPSRKRIEGWVAPASAQCPPVDSFAASSRFRNTHPKSLLSRTRGGSSGATLPFEGPLAIARPFTSSPPREPNFYGHHAAHARLSAFAGAPGPRRGSLSLRRAGRAIPG